MLWFTCLLVVMLALLAGSPWLFADRVLRRRRLRFDKTQRIRLRTR